MEWNDVYRGKPKVLYPRSKIHNGFYVDPFGWSMEPCQSGGAFLLVFFSTYSLVRFSQRRESRKEPLSHPPPMLCVARTWNSHVGIHQQLQNPPHKDFSRVRQTWHNHSSQTLNFPRLNRLGCQLVARESGSMVTCRPRSMVQCKIWHFVGSVILPPSLSPPSHSRQKQTKARWYNSQPSLKLQRHTNCKTETRT